MIIRCKTLTLFLAMSFFSFGAYAQECRVAGSDPDPTPPPPTNSPGVIFQTDFSQDAGYNESGVRLWNQNSAGPVAPPTGWDGVYAPNSRSNISVISGAGYQGSNALRLAWAPGGDQTTIRLGKHLTGNVNQGFDELYIRYRVKLPDNFKAGRPGSSLPYWKWGRLWQNTWPQPGGAPNENRWSENRANSGYVVWNFGGSEAYTDVNVTWSENTGSNLASGSSGGARQKLDYFVSGSDRTSQDGYFQSFGGGAWSFDASRPRYLAAQPQRYHTIEYRFKLASSPTANDGVFEMWWDGQKQAPHSRMIGEGGAPQRQGIPTANRGSGFNFLVMFDNILDWHSDWGRSDVDGFVLISDVVVSQTPIGSNYVVTGTN